MAVEDEHAGLLLMIVSDMLECGLCSAQLFERYQLYWDGLLEGSCLVVVSFVLYYGDESQRRLGLDLDVGVRSALLAVWVC